MHFSSDSTRKEEGMEYSFKAEPGGTLDQVSKEESRTTLAQCKICNSEAKPFATSTILRKYTGSYFRCPQCGFVFISDPIWLSEAYSSALAKADVGAIKRNALTANVTCCVLRLLRPKSKSFLDFGGGHGTFVRMMRDFGFDFHWTDAIAENLYARGFEQEQGRKYDLVTSFEVLEHLVNPLEEIGRMMEIADDVLVSTEVISDPPPLPGEWWYYAVSTGQHISFYSKKTLQTIAKKFNRHVVSVGGIHLFSKSQVSALAFALIAQPRLAKFTKEFTRRPSLIEADFERFTS